MDSGYYAAMTGLVARTQALDTAAANLANAQTPGYRAEREYFRSALLGPGAADSQLGRTVNNYGLLGGDRLSMTQGPLQKTGNPFDLAIEGEGFFQIQAAQRPPLHAGWQLSPFADRHSRYFSRRTGTFSGGQDDCRSAGRSCGWRRRGPVGGGRRGGSIGVFTFPSAVNLVPEGANRYVAPVGVTPLPSKAASVHQGSLESANQDVVQGSMDLLVMQRQAEMMQKALTVFHTEFNKIATEDLPRV